MNKDTTLSIRISTGDLEQIKDRAKQARMSQSDYITRFCLGRQVVVINATGLSRTAEELAGVSAALRELQERRRWRP